MSEPTPEEREGGLALADLVVRELEMKDLLPSKVVDVITRYLSTLIRAAVAAERERLGCIDAVVEASGNHVPGCPCRSCGYWEKHVRIMVAAETSRCASLNYNEAADCPTCGQQAPVPCWDEVNNHPASGVHFARIAAAIRRTNNPEPSEESERE